MISVRVLNKDPLGDIREAIAATIGKENLKEFDGDLISYYMDLFIQGHSIIRAVRFRIKDTEADKASTRQLLRATTGSPQPYVESSRPDWTGKPRNEDETCLFLHDHTAESFMNEARQRLCTRAWAPTRQKVKEIIMAMWDSADPYFEALALCCVPSCVTFYGCPEGKFNCGWWDKQTYPTPIAERRMLYFINSLGGGGVHGTDTDKDGT